MTDKQIQPTLQVTLSNENEFRGYLYSIFIEELERAKEDAGKNKKIMNTTEMSSYLGISPTTLRQYEKLGLPFSSIGKRKFYDVDECRRWITKQQID